MAGAAGSSSSFLDAAFQDLMDEDGLLVVARGLGKQRLLARFLRLQAESAAAAQGLFAASASASGTDEGSGGASLGPVLCLNMAGPADHQMLAHALKAEGLAASKLPRVIDNDVPKPQREALYKRGGVFLVTSRILVVDMLANVLDVGRVRGLVVNHAHRVTETSTEAFIVRIYRQRNCTGFLKALTDEPEPLLQGFAKMEKVLRFLYLRRVYLWPRYHVAVKEYLGRHEPEVVELAQALTPAMKAIQKAVLVCMDGCLKELKRVTTLSLEGGGEELTLANGIFRSFHATLRRQLDPEWHRLSPKTKQLVEDLRVLRTLLDYLLRYDAVAFYSFLVALQRSNAQQRYPSPWLASVAADRLFFHAKARMYRLRSLVVKKEEGGKGEGKGKEKAAGGGAGVVLDVVLEEHPKWRLLKDVLAEIAREHDTAAKGKGKEKRTGEEEGEQKGEEEGGSAVSATAATSPPATGKTGGGSGSSSSSQGGEEKETWEEKGEETGPGVLVLVRDEMCSAYLRAFLQKGGGALMRERFRHFLAQVQPVHKQIVGSSASFSSGGDGGGNGGKGQGKGSGGKGRWGSGRGKGNCGGGGGSAAVSNGGGGTASESGKAAVAAEEKRLLAEYLAGMLGEEREAKSAAKARAKAAAAAAAAAAAVREEEKERDGDPEATEDEEEGKEGGVWIREGGGNSSDDEEGEEEEEGSTLSSGEEGKPPPPPPKAAAPAGGRGDKEAKEVAAGAAGAAAAKGKGGGKGGGRKKKGWKRGRPGPVARVLRGLKEGASGSKASGAAATQAGKGKRKRGGAEDGEEEESTLARAEAFFLLQQQQQQQQREEAQAGGAMGAVGGVRVWLVTYKEAGMNMALLDELRPQYVVLYDPDPQFVREIEVHQASRTDNVTLRVYFCVYEESVEEQRYLTALTREKEAFERLVHEKKHIVMPTDPLEAAALAPQPGGTYIDKLVADTRARKRGLPPRPECKKVVVDVREFRSSLPSLLHEAGMLLVPATLEVGDFVLTPEIVVERKSVSDLFGSFASGRLYTQVEAMLRHYKVATLLVEFQSDKAFGLQNKNEISEEIQLTSICSKLALLTLRFPELRILWARSSHCTVQLFQALKVNNAPVDVAKALTAGGGSAAGEDSSTSRNMAAQEFLLKLPGVNASNVRTIMQNVESLAALAGMGQEELKGLLESEANAKKLYEFLHTNPNKVGGGEGGAGKK